MFTGIVQEQGTLLSREDAGGDARLKIDVPEPWSQGIRIGDSIAVNGVCLTVTDVQDNRLSFDVSAETLSATRLGALVSGAPLNLEKALSAADPVGGHFVSGHVDGVGEVVRVEEDGRSRRVEVEAPESLARFIAQKGCITVDGVSLTVNKVKGARFGVNIVPHTWSATTMQHYEPGTRVNLEVDLIARYLDRLMSDREAPPPEDDITADYLSERGFAPPVFDDEDQTPEQEDRLAEDGSDEPGPA